MLVISIDIIFRPKNDAAVSSKTSSIKNHQNKVDENKITPIKVNSNVQNSNVFLFQDTLNFSLSTDFNM